MLFQVMVDICEFGLSGPSEATHLSLHQDQDYGRLLEICRFQVDSTSPTQLFLPKLYRLSTPKAGVPNY